MTQRAHNRYVFYILGMVEKRGFHFYNCGQKYYFEPTWNWSGISAQPYFIMNYIFLILSFYVPWQVFDLITKYLNIDNELANLHMVFIFAV